MESHWKDKLSLLGIGRATLLNHLKRSLGSKSVFYLEFLGSNICCVNYNDTIITRSEHPMERVNEYYPLKQIVVLDDVNVLREFKSILGRKKATIAFKYDGDDMFCLYQYESLVDTGSVTITDKGKEKKVREKRMIEGNLCLGKRYPNTHELALFTVVSVFWRFDPLNEANNILDIVECEKETPPSKLEFDVVDIDNVLLNKHDILKLLQIYKNGVKTLYAEYDPAHGVASFCAPESDIEIYMTTVQEHKDD